MMLWGARIGPFEQWMTSLCCIAIANAPQDASLKHALLLDHRLPTLPLDNSCCVSTPQANLARLRPASMPMSDNTAGFERQDVPHAADQGMAGPQQPQRVAAYAFGPYDQAQATAQPMQGPAMGHG